MNLKILITNSNNKNALAAARSLGRKGYFIGVSGIRETDYVSCSRYVSQTFHHSDVLLYPDKVKSQFKSFLSENKYDVILPIGIDMSTFFSNNLHFFQKFINIPISNYSTFLKMHDKMKTIKIAKDLDIPVPITHSPKNLKEYEKIALLLDFPHVIKARKGSGNSGVYVINNLNEGNETFDKLIHKKTKNEVYDCTNPLVQEYIDGEIHDVCLASKRGNVFAIMTQKRIKTLPPGGGSGIVNITTNQKRIARYAIRLIKSIGWTGVSQIEFKLDSNSNPRIMEINPKFWGTLDLSIKAGINFPEIAVDLALGNQLKIQNKYKKNLTYRWLFPYELYHLLKTKSGFIDFFRFKQNTVTNLSTTDFYPDIFRAINFSL